MHYQISMSLSRIH